MSDSSSNTQFKYGQLYKGRIIYTIDTNLTMGELSNHFDPNTIWVDLSKNRNVDVGWVQTIDGSGNMVFSRQDVVIEDTQDSVTKLYYTALYNIKLQRQKYINKICRTKGYTDYIDLISYASIYNIIFKAGDEIKLNDAEIIANYIVDTDAIIEKYLKDTITKDTGVSVFINTEFKDYIGKDPLNLEPLVLKLK